MPTASVVLLPTIVLKRTDAYEARWTSFLAPGVFLAYRRGWLVERRIKGTRLDRVSNCYRQHVLLAAQALGKLHRRATEPAAPPIRRMGSWRDNLSLLWSTPKYALTGDEYQVLEHLSPLFRALEGVERDCVFKDANPRNWIVSGGHLVAIDYGAMSAGSFASDLAQLIDYRWPFEADMDIWYRAVEAWASGYGPGAPTSRLEQDLLPVVVYSALCRIPFHPVQNRITWYNRTARRVAWYGWTSLAQALARTAGTLARRRAEINMQPKQLTRSKHDEA